MKKVFTENKNNMFIRSSTSGNRSLRLREEGYFRSDGGCVCVSVWGEGGQQVLNEEQQKKKEAQDKAVSLSHPLALSIQNQTLHTRKQAEETLCVCLSWWMQHCSNISYARRDDGL